MRKILSTLIIILFPAISCAVEANTVKYETRKIIPPKLDQANLGEKMLCYRPMRTGSPNMSVTKEGNKVIAHNYGHGGSG